MSRVEQEVKKFQEEILTNETKHQLLEIRNRNLELLVQRAHDEIKLYVSNKAEDKKKSVREQLLKQVIKGCYFWIRSPYPFYKCIPIQYTLDTYQSHTKY